MNKISSTGMSIPTSNSMPPLPQRPFLPFSMKMPVRVIITRERAKASPNQVHHLPGL